MFIFHFIKRERWESEIKRLSIKLISVVAFVKSQFYLLHDGEAILCAVINLQFYTNKDRGPLFWIH